MNSKFEEYPEAAASTSAAGAAAAFASSAGAGEASTSLAGFGGPSTLFAGFGGPSTSFAGFGEASTSFAGLVAGAGEASTSAQWPRPMLGLQSQSFATDCIELLEAAALYSDAPINQNAHLAQTDVDALQAEFIAAVQAYGLRLRIRGGMDYNYDLCMAALDNVINRHIEATRPSEEKIDFIKGMMNRFYQVMVIWVANGLTE